MSYFQSDFTFAEILQQMESRDRNDFLRSYDHGEDPRRAPAKGTLEAARKIKEAYDELMASNLTTANLRRFLRAAARRGETQFPTYVPGKLLA